MRGGDVRGSIRLSLGMVSEAGSKPNTRLPRGVSAFEACWLAEALRLREGREGRLDDREAVAAARGAGGTLAERILRRAVVLGEREGLVAAVEGWRVRARLAIVLGAVLAAAGGFGAALAVLGDGTRAVNVVWALGGLLGVHLLSLAAWVGSPWLSSGAGGGMLGRIWLRLAAGKTARGDLGQALVELVGRSRLAPWWLGAVTHGLWLLALGAALAGLMLSLAVRGYGFVWETTILPAEVFVRFVELLGWLPARLGFEVPDAAVIRASASGPVSGEAARIAWSSWLVGCVVVYGVLPRLLLWTFCLFRWRRGQARLRPDTSRPGYAALRERLEPASERIGITDPDAHRQAGTWPAPGSAEGGAGALLVGLELGGRQSWPPALLQGVTDAGVIDTREDRQRLVEALRAATPRRLVVACDARLSPDRGSLQFAAELAQHAGECRVWLLGAGHDAQPARLMHWREGLAEAGFASEAIMESEAKALDWLGAAHDDEATRRLGGQA